MAAFWFIFTFLLVSIFLQAECMRCCEKCGKNYIPYEGRCVPAQIFGQKRYAENEAPRPSYDGDICCHLCGLPADNWIQKSDGDKQYCQRQNYKNQVISVENLESYEDMDCVLCSGLTHALRVALLSAGNDIDAVKVQLFAYCNILPSFSSSCKIHAEKHLAFVASHYENGISDNDV